MLVSELDTPCLLLDLDAMERNIATMAKALEGTGVRVRPHFKTPKSPEVARRQLAAGAIGITVAKLGEAEVLADAGLGPLLMANQVVGPVKLARLTSLLAKGVDITIAVESEFNVRELAEAAKAAGVTAQAIIEVDSGMHRCGTDDPAETVRLARLMEDLGVRYRGLMGYEGHTVHIDDRGERTEKATVALTIVGQHADALAEAGLPPEIVSVGGTGTYDIASRHPGVTEIQAGTYVFMDGRYHQVFAEPFECALTFLTTILSVKDTYAVCDAGMKSLSRDMGMPETAAGRIKVRGLSEEHAHLVGEGIADLKPGDRVELIPSHGDTTLNMHDNYYVRRGGEVIDTWPILAARKFR
jgi:D-serine deaminase-like pyridoxal phosphate-dependent protein